MKIVDRVKLDQLSREAAISPRRRKNFNLHDDYSDRCQRLFNALEPGTYIRPHRHVDPPKPECFVAVRGRMILVVFDDNGSIAQTVLFGEDTGVLAIDLPSGQWHTLIALDPGSIFFETKPGPYTPLSDKDFAPWAPSEESPDASRYLSSLTALVVKT